MTLSIRHAAVFIVIQQVYGQSIKDGKGLFSYDSMADNGPDFWHLIDTSPDVNACDGNRQSPVGFSAEDLLTCDVTNADYTFNVSKGQLGVSASEKKVLLHICKRICSFSLLFRCLLLPSGWYMYFGSTCLLQQRSLG